MQDAAMIRNICVFCGSRSGASTVFAEDAREFGRQMALRKLRLIYGGGGTGLMGEMARAVLTAGGDVTGVMPRFLIDREAAMKDLSDLRVVTTMHERKALLTHLADAFVALPGGIGTLEELFEIWSHAQLGLHAKPIGLLNTAGFFDSLIEFCERSVDAGFTKRERFRLLIIANSVSELIGRLAG